MTDEDIDYDPTRADEYWPGEWMSRDAIEPNNWNPNELDEDEFERLVESIKDNGWTMPIVVHAEDHYIIDGEHRWIASKYLPDDPDLTPEGVPSDYVPVYGITVEEYQAKLATVQHNRARGDIRIDRFQKYLEGLDDRGVLDHVQAKIGVEDSEVRELLGDIGTPSLPDETMPWEEEEDPEVVDGAEDDSEGEEDEDDERELPIPELHQDRTAALRAGDEERLDEDTLVNVETLIEPLGNSEFERACEALGTEMRAQSLVNLCRYIDDHDIREDVEAY